MSEPNEAGRPRQESGPETPANKSDHILCGPWLERVRCNRKAQREVDRLIGRDKMPDLDRTYPRIVLRESGRPS